MRALFMYFGLHYRSGYAHRNLMKDKISLKNPEHKMRPNNAAMILSRVDAERAAGTMED